VDTVGQIHGLSSGVVLISVAANGENAIVVSPGANMVWSHEAVAKVNRAVAGARLLVVNLEVPPSVVATAVRVARAAGGTVILNPAPHRTGNEECFRNVDFFVPNQIEAAVFAGMEPESVDDWRAIGWRLRELGPRNLVITMGAVGALLVSDDGEALCPGFQVPATDTTAAGDAFVGGLSVALLKKLSLPEVVKYVNACGALALTRVGAQPSLPRAAEVEDFIVIV
jgi:ribokinase